MTTALTLTAAVPERGVDLDVLVPDGDTVAVMGPNGAGKSTLLQVAAGLLRPTTGQVVLDGRVLCETRGDRGAWVPAYDRGVALLSQDALLFPHLSVLDNVAFGPRAAGQSRAQSRRTARHWLSELDAGDLEDRRPAQLSGGQAQRVALARALATEPRLLLLDEPLAAVDARAAGGLRVVLRRVLAGRSALMVTHDVLDALVVSDRIAVVEGGRVVEEGPTRAVLARPTSDFAARVAGLNLVRGRFDGAAVVGDGIRVVGHAESQRAARPGDEAVAVFRPSSVAVHLHPPGGSPRNVLPAVVTDVQPLGDHVRVRGGELGADISLAAAAELGVRPGLSVCFVVKANDIDIYPLTARRATAE